MNIQRQLARKGATADDEDNASAPASSQGLELTNLLRVIRIRRTIILGTMSIALVLVLVVLFQLTPLYTASAVVMLDEQKNKVADVNAVLSGLPTDPSSIQNQVQILTSRRLASRVIDRLHLEQDPEFNGDETGWRTLIKSIIPKDLFGRGVSVQTAAEEAEDHKQLVVDNYLQHLSVSPLGLSTAITVSFQCKDPRKAAHITNTIAEEYVDDQLNAKFEATQKATQWLTARIQQLAGQVQVADAGVQQYKAENNLSETAEGNSIADQQLATISGQLVAARSDLAQRQAIYGRVLSLSRAGRAADVSQVVASPLIAQLRAQETDLLRQEADMSAQFGPRHPKMLNLESQKQNLEDKIAEEVRRVIETVASDVSVAQANVSSLQASLNQAEGTSQGQNKSKVQLKSLESAATSSRAMYEAFLGRLKETQGQEGIQTPDARIISAAAVPDSPSFPNKGLVIGAAVPLSLVLGLLFAFGAERLDSGFRTPNQIETLVGLPVLATIPEITPSRSDDGKAESVNAADRVIDRPMSAFAEAVRGLLLGLALSNVDKEPKVVVVASSVPSEGKTTVAVSMARLAARNGRKVVVIDCDLRRPTLAKVAGLVPAESGIVEALASGGNPEGFLIRDPRSDAMILPCHKSPANPPDLLGSHAMEKLIANLRANFDFVVIDSAPLLPVHDTRIVSKYADAVLFVTRWEKTPRDAVVNALRTLKDAKAPIAGIALARADGQRFQYYSYGYQSYHAYNKYYNE